jgi:glycine cleavage system aminomethyltransferase T
MSSSTSVESIAYPWLPAEDATVGTPVEIVYFGERYPAQVVSEPRSIQR